MFRTNTKLFSLMLFNNNINSIQSQSFKHNKIARFNITNNKLSGTLQKYNLTGIYVTDLNFSNGQLTTIAPGAFTSMSATLQILDLKSNSIYSISRNAFELLENLKLLDISNNRIGKVNFLMNDLKQLTTLNISRNGLNKIFRNTFENITSLNQLDLSHNFITEIEPNTFIGLKNLEKLQINDNEIKELQKGTFEGLSAVRFIEMSFLKYKVLQNESFCDLKFLKLINSSHGELENIEYNAFKNVESVAYLDFSFNSLSIFKVNTRSVMGAERIYLGHNRISHIDDETFRGLIHLRLLELSNNSFLTITANAFKSLVHLVALDVSSNRNIYFTNTSNTSKISKDSFSATDIDINEFPTTLNLAHCDIENITLVYTLLLNVKVLLLSSNNIAIITKESFRNKFMMPVEIIDLSLNVINYVQPGSFLNLRNVKQINFRENFISHLEHGVFNGLSNLEKLDVSFNSITSFDSIILLNSRVNVLILDNNKITSLKLGSRPTRSSGKIQLSIGGNLITCKALNWILVYDKSIELNSLTSEYYTQNVNGITCV